MNDNFMEQEAQKAFGNSFVEAKDTNTCVRCGKSVTEHKTTLYAREYEISRLCDECQDHIFVEPDDDCSL